MVGLLGGRAYGCGSCERGQLLPRLKKASDASSTAAIAVPFPSGVWTYEQLERRAMSIVRRRFQVCAPTGGATGGYSQHDRGWQSYRIGRTGASDSQCDCRTV